MNSLRIIRMIELMLYREAGGTGYDFAIAKIAGEYPDIYADITAKIKGIKDE